MAIGLGSRKMDGAAIFMGYIGSDGKPQFTVQLGKGKRHSDAPADMAATVKSSVVKQDNGKTTLEIAVSAASYIKAGQDKLDVIFAMADDRNFTQYHNYRGVTSLTLQ